MRMPIHRIFLRVSSVFLVVLVIILGSFYFLPHGRVYSLSMKAFDSDNAPDKINSLIKIFMKTNRIETPLGYEMKRISLSWTVEGSKNTKAVSQQIQISKFPDFSEILHDSGSKSEINHRDYEPELNLKPRTRYYWKILINFGARNVISNVSWFETGKMEETWQANWISYKHSQDRAPYFRKSILITKNIKNARIYASGLGMYELYANGNKVTNELFAPGYTQYDNWIQYQTYDVSTILQKGNNVIGALVGDGWAKGRFGFGGNAADMNSKGEELGETRNQFIKRHCFIAEIHVTYEDDSEDIFYTDSSWKAAKSPILINNIYDGEVYDATQEISDWCSPNSKDDKNWENVEEIKTNLGQLMDRKGPPVVINEQIKPFKITTSPDKEIIVDFGQNMAGWVEFDADFPKNHEVILQYCEILQEGNYYRENLNTAQQEFHFISNGKKQHVRPHFTYYGFRFIKVTNWPNPQDLVACAIYSKLDRLGYIETGNELVDRLYQNILWSQRSNFVDIPTDCPQRAERMGWTGDAEVFSPTAMYNMDCYAFYSKFMRDLAFAQKKVNGAVPSFLPSRGFDEGYSGACGWADAATIIPWNMYVFTGNKQILYDQFDSMKAWVDYVKKKSHNGLWKAENNYFGDWLALDGPNYRQLNPQGTIGGTELDFICAAYYYRSTTILSKTARVLGKEKIFKEYQTLSNEILKNIHTEYFTQSGRCAITTQTGHALAIEFDLVPKGKEGIVAETLKRIVENSGFHVQTGVLGTAIICKAMSRVHLDKEVYRMFTQTEFPGWLPTIGLGATTIWERWDGIYPNKEISPYRMNSFNHYALGSVGDWMYSCMCGIKPNEDYPGFARFFIEPQPSSKVNRAKAIYHSASGKIESSWAIDDGVIKYSIVVPFGTRADVFLNRIQAETISSEQNIKWKYNSERMGSEVTLEAGTYSFKAPPNAEIMDVDMSQFLFE